MSSEEKYYLIANGDLRDSANIAGWPEQSQLEADLVRIFSSRNIEVKRAHPVSEGPEGHGFISNQAMGNRVVLSIPEGATVVSAHSVWQYSHHILGALVQRRDLKILTIANFDGTWPGLVGMANLNASLLKHKRDFSTIWAEDLNSEEALARIDEFISTGRVVYSRDHIRAFDSSAESLKSRFAEALAIGREEALKVKTERRILGYFDEMCMGMENAVIPNSLLYPLGLGKENMSQSALFAEMNGVGDAEGAEVIQWLRDRGMRFETGSDEARDLTEKQLTEQGKMYIAAARIAERFGCDAIGIQYQQGLKDIAPASDLVEGLLNNPDRPPVKNEKGETIREGRAIPCFNEVDGGCAVDLILSKEVWDRFGEDPSANQEDIRWARHYSGKALTTEGEVELDNEDVWVELLSGSAPASHFENGYAGAVGYRQNPVYFPYGGATLAGVGKAGEVVVSRVYIADNGKLSMNIMRGRTVTLPEGETKDRLDKTEKSWPIKHLIRDGVDRDAMLGHPSNHETILYASSKETADKMALAKAAMAHDMGMEVFLWGDLADLI